MTDDPVIRAVLDKYPDTIHLSDVGEAPEQTNPFAQYCTDSKAYWHYTDEVLNRYVRGSTDQIRLAQAKVLLTDRFLDFRAYATREHRDKLGDKGHTCLYQVWIAAMHEIRTKQLTLDPPRVMKLVAPKPEAPATSSSYALLPPAVFLGEWKE